MAPTRAGAPTRGRTTAPAHRRGAVGVHRDAVRSGRRDAGATRGRSAAVVRAYARRAQRTGAPRGGPAKADAGRAPFVMVVMVLLTVALVTTLWLSTAATAGSYHLQSARKDARNLTERSESLGREVATLETAPELARRARELGMVPAGDVAQLVLRPDGAVVVIGQPRRVTAPALASAPPAPARPPLTPPIAVAVPPVAAPVPSVAAPGPLAAQAAPPPAPIAPPPSGGM